LGQDITCLTSVQSIDLKRSTILKYLYDLMIQLPILTTMNYIELFYSHNKISQHFHDN